MRPVILRYSEHPTFDTTVAALSAASAEFRANRDQSHLLVVDISRMKTYQAASREYFIQWIEEHRRHVAAVAIITENRLWDMLVRAIAFSTGCRMASFPTVPAALRWVDARPGSARILSAPWSRRPSGPPTGSDERDPVGESVVAAGRGA